MSPTAPITRSHRDGRAKPPPRPSASGPAPDRLRSVSERNRELEMLLHVTCHDLRSPLVNIQGFTQELTRTCHKIRTLIDRTPGHTVPKASLRTLLEEEAAEAVGFIQSGLARMESLLDEVLRFTRMDRLALNLQLLDMNALLDRIVRAMQYQIHQARAHIAIAPLPACLGDKIQIDQVFANLLDNALKFLKPGRAGKISVTGRARAREAVFCVRDNGIGIAPRDRHRIFEPFSQVNPACGPGAGLGLAISRRLLERLHGRIWVESTPRRGSAFYVSLPLAVQGRPDATGSAKRIR